ncbi:helix-loop-helix DNA-binding domain-containing protein [Loa loa]|uniref:Helix-loop-helix DNA-binding domain-containing protein n=1 Tax=Loa loa TaxID=7209 RepID=A0A1I7VSQ9_LOALO|nr:helix-loop-helix DNA-binding domain-containing protein [Loa loa]EFO21686.1 helix-loop-helix DNA-binding domain-containing protein [Loa loa]
MSDVDFSDGEEDGATNSTLATDSKRHARAQHNALERRRRDNIKDMYGALKDTIPGMRNERASRAAVLKKSIDLITSKQADLEKILAENQKLEQENDILEHEIERLKQRAESQVTGTASDDANRWTNRDTLGNDATSGSDLSQLNAHFTLPNRKRPAPTDDQSTLPRNA